MKLQFAIFVLCLGVAVASRLRTARQTGGSSYNANTQGRQLVAANQPLIPHSNSFQNPRPFYRILRQNFENHGNGHFQYDYLTENGIEANAVGTPGVNGQSNIQGGYKFTFPEGIEAEVYYTADEGGYRPESNLIPTPHPLPAHAIAQIQFAEEQRARGLCWQNAGYWDTC